MRARFGIMAVAALVGVTAACGDDDDADDGPETTSLVVATTTKIVENTESPASIGEADTDTKQIVEVTATDYRFDGLPASVPVGTQLALQNNSTKEVHEMVIVRIPDEVTETVGQILALTEEEQQELVGDIAPSAVIVALPGEAGMAMEGDGTLDEPGRYAVLCFIPEGADPALVREAMEGPPPTGDAEGEPDLGDGPPHIMKGMYAEVRVVEP